jgi:pimeloyl-ACP methyl ester carboxylesterase
MHTKGLRKASWNVIRDMPADCRREIIFRDLLVRGAKLFAAEGKQFLSGLMLMRDDGSKISDIDVTVIAGSDPDVLSEAYSAGMVRAQRETAEVLNRGRLVLAHNSAHYAPLTEPDVVAREVLNAVDKHRSE